MASKLLKLALPVGGVAATAAFLLSDDRKPLRSALAFATSTEKKSFDDYFPRGEWNDNWDFRDPQFLVNNKKYEAASTEDKAKMLGDVKAKATRNIILIRHGQYQMDTKEKFLTELGREQAALIGKRLSETGIKFDSVVMSTMNRATETANIILEYLPKELKRSSCSLIEEGPPYPPVPAVDHWKPPKSEFFSEGARIESAFRRHIHRASPQQQEDSYEVIVCHANVIRYFICRALQFPPEGWLRFSLGNCSITMLIIRPNGRVSLRSAGDVGHLHPDKITYT